MTGGEIFGLCWLASVVALFAWYLRAEVGADREGGR